MKFYTSVAKGLKLKARRFLALIPTIAEVTEEKLVGGGAFLPPILNRANILNICNCYKSNEIVKIVTKKKKFHGKSIYLINIKSQRNIFRSSCPKVFCKKGVLRHFAKFTGKILCQSLFLNKVAGLRPH